MNESMSDMLVHLHSTLVHVEREREREKVAFSYVAGTKNYVPG